MRILIADKFHPRGIERLSELGHEVLSEPSLSAGDLPETLAAKRPEILIVRSTKVTATSFEAAEGLALVIRAGAGVNTIDLEAASRLGIFVANCPGKNAIAVAELTMGLMLALDRRIPDANADLRAGVWNKKKYGTGRGLYGRRLGLVGFGSIAREVATRALAFGMQVRAYSPTLTAERADAYDVEVAPSLDALLGDSDVVSVHVPYRESTRHLIGAPQLALMPEGAVLVHTARGGVVDDRALSEAVAAGRIRAGLDVYEDEPSGGKAEFNLELRKLEGVYGTPHIGASTQQAAEAIAAEAIRIVTSFADRGVVPNTVNLDDHGPARHTLVVRHHDRVGVLASILDALRKHQLNVQDMHNVVFKGAEGAASATIAVENEPSADLLDDIRAHADVLGVDLRTAR
ncbi:phosphoglycerate dehydrogenase [Plesiocystis pacifica]|uniref:phosphoglycerate dehydrogenase n=1 Tax=Plesiocystis pacifica TaxID=191768 RepID=UPI0005D46F99|nr:phosphoglycerate dehydrogenase [Plesiocystis pacifica]